MLYTTVVGGGQFVPKSCGQQHVKLHLVPTHERLPGHKGLIPQYAYHCHPTESAQATVAGAGRINWLVALFQGQFLRFLHTYGCYKMYKPHKGCLVRQTHPLI